MLRKSSKVSQRNLKSKGNKQISQSQQLEDQYIENLKKQIHFMNLEIDKQKTNKGFFELQELMGNNTGEPVQHIIETTDKFQNMQKEIRKKQTDLQLQILEVKQNIDFEKTNKKKLSEQISELQTKLQKLDTSKIDNLQKKIQQIQKVNSELEQKQQKLNEQKKFVIQENEELTHKKRNKDDLNNLDDKAYNNELERIQNSISLFDEKIENLKTQKQELISLADKDIQTQEYRERNKEIQNLLIDKLCQYDQLEYEVQELECLQRLSLEDKQKSQDQRKQLSNEVETLQQQLEELKNLNQLQIERKVNEGDDEQVQKNETALRIEKQETEDIQEQFNDIHRVYVKYKLERNQRLFSLETIQKQNQDLQEEINQLSQQYEELLDSTKTKRIEHEQNEMDVKQKRINLKSLENQTYELEREIGGYQSEINFLNENLDLKQKMKELKLDELRQVMQLNANVNKTLEGVINKWDEIKEISNNQLIQTRQKYKSLFSMSNMKQGLKLFNDQNQNDKKQQSKYQELDADEFTMDTHNIIENTQQDKNKKGNQIKKITKWGSEDENDNFEFKDNVVQKSQKENKMELAKNRWNKPVNVKQTQFSNEQQQKAKELAESLGQKNEKKVVKKVKKSNVTGKDLSSWMNRDEDEEEKKKLEAERQRRLKELEGDDEKTQEKEIKKETKKLKKGTKEKKKVSKKNVTKKKTSKVNKQVVKKKPSIGGTGVTTGKTWDE